MSDRYDNSRRRGVLTHWVPLVLTLTIATAGVAAWAWSQRSRDDYDEDDETEQLQRQQQQQQQQEQQQPQQPGTYAGGSGRFDQQTTRPYDHLDNDRADYGNNRYGALTPQPSVVGQGDPSVASGWSARMSGALSRTASPQHWMGNASKAVTAGISAASAVVGGAIASIRESDKDAYADHETWSEEVDARHARPTASSAVTIVPPAAGVSTAPFSKDLVDRKRKTVAVVVSADHFVDPDENGFYEHAVSAS